MKTPEQIAQSIITACADCDTCRFLMDSNCLMFPELYCLYDKEVETGKKEKLPILPAVPAVIFFPMFPRPSLRFCSTMKSKFITPINAAAACRACWKGIKS